MAKESVYADENYTKECVDKVLAILEIKPEGLLTTSFQKAKKKGLEKDYSGLFDYYKKEYNLRTPSEVCDKLVEELYQTKRIRKRKLPRRLSPEEKEEAILLFNCGFNRERVGKEYDVSGALIRGILSKARKENKFVRSGNQPRKGFDYAAKNWLRLKGKHACSAREKELTMLLEEEIIYPVVDETIKKSGLAQLLGFVELDGYERLLEDLFGGIDSDELKSKMRSGLLKYAKRNPPQEGSDYRQEIKEVLEDYLGNQIKEYFFPKLPPEGKEKVEELLKGLIPREETVLRMRYGIGEKRGEYLGKIGKELGLSKERTRQLEARALKKLRDPRRIKELKEYIFIEEGTEKIERQKREIANLEERLGKAEEIIKAYEAEKGDMIKDEYKLEKYLSEEAKAYLERSIGEFDFPDFTVRVHNCLEKANIKTVKELVEKREVDLLKIPGFGQKSLRNVKQVLEEIGLRLGMEFFE